MRKPIHLTVAMLTLGLTSPALATEADWEGVEKALGVPGSVEPGDVYKVSLPRSDLKVTADGVPVKAAFALGSWLAFKKAGEETMVMGDLVLTGEEINPVISKLEEGGSRSRPCTTTWTTSSRTSCSCTSVARAVQLSSPRPCTPVWR
jgi:hypothetical protein